jgi:hypothetical protein
MKRLLFLLTFITTLGFLGYYFYQYEKLTEHYNALVTDYNLQKASFNCMLDIKTWNNKDIGYIKVDDIKQCMEKLNKTQ